MTVLEIKDNIHKFPAVSPSYNWWNSTPNRNFSQNLLNSIWISLTNAIDQTISGQDKYINLWGTNQIKSTDFIAKSLV